MSQKIYLLFISFLIGVFSYAQTKTDSILVKEKPQVFVGIDLLNPVVSFFSDKKNFNGFISYKIKKRWTAVAEVGYEKNSYKKNDWNIEAKGAYGQVGVNYIISSNYEKTGEGFYVGGRIGFSPYKQNIKNYPIKGMNTGGYIQALEGNSLPESSVASGWFEAVAGAKVQIATSPFYIDFMIKPKFLIFSKKQQDIDNLVIPGYGKDKGIANISFFWGISYRIF